MQSLEMELARAMDWSADKLSEYGFFSSASRLGNHLYTTPLVAQMSDALVKGFGRGYLIEQRFDKVITDLQGGATRKNVVLSEIAKSVIDDVSFFATVKLNGQCEEAFVSDESVAADAVTSFTRKYRRLQREGVISSEQNLANYIAETFHSWLQAEKKSFPDGSYVLVDSLVSGVAHESGGKVGDPVSMRSGGSGDADSFFVPQKSRYCLDDVVGCDDQKGRITRSLINPFSKSKQWAALKKDADKIVDNYNFLFHGPPGTGKTYFAQSVAGELNIPCYIVSGPDFSKSYHAQGKEMLAQLYAKASEHQQALVVIDEADVLCYARGSRETELTTDTITEFLTILDGVKSSGHVATILSTNRRDRFDSAILSKIPQANQLYFGPLDKETQTRIFTHHLGRYNHSVVADELSSLLQRQDDFDPRKITQVCQDAAFYALDAGRSLIGLDELSRSLNDYAGDKV